jgi:hypothetical protein
MCLDNKTKPALKKVGSDPKDTNVERERGGAPHDAGDKREVLERGVCPFGLERVQKIMYPNDPRRCLFRTPGVYPGRRRNGDSGRIYIDRRAAGARLPCMEFTKFHFR